MRLTTLPFAALCLALGLLLTPRPLQAQVPRFEATPFSDLEALRSKDAAARRASASALARFRKNPEVLSALIKAVGTDPDVGVRQAAATTLAKIGGGQARAALAVAAVCDPDAATREGLAPFARRANVLCHEQKVALPAPDKMPRGEAELTEQLDHPSPGVRRAAIKELAKRRSARGARKIWTMAAQDPVWKIRALALQTIIKFYRKKSFSVLQHTVTQDPDARARAVALGCLAQIGHPKAVATAAASARVEQIPEVQVAAVNALAFVGNKKAIRQLSFIAQMHQSEEARAAAVTALTKSDKHRKQIKTVLAAVLKNDRSGKVRAAALKALSTDNSPAACKARASRIDDPSPDVRAALVEQLAACDAQIATPALKRAARDDDEAAVRKAAVQTLAKLGVAQHRDFILQILRHDRANEVRRAAFTAVKGQPAEEIHGALTAVVRGDDDTGLRRAAVKLLASYSAMMAVPGLAAALENDREEKIRLVAVKALGRYRDATAYKALRAAAANDPSAKVKRLAQRAAARSPARKAWVDALLPQTIDPSPRVRKEAVTKLCELASPHTYRALVRALWMDDDSSVRMAVARGFSEIEHALADVGLVVAHDTDPDSSLVRAIEQTQAHRVGRLNALLAATKHPDKDERLAAVKSLRPSPFKRVRTTLVTLLSEDESPEVRQAAGVALARYEDQQALKTLGQAARKELDSRTRQTLITFYNKLRSRWDKTRATLGVSRLIRQLQSGSAAQKIRAAQDLGVMKDRQAFSALKAATKAKAPKLRYEAVLALAIFGDNATIAKAAREEKDEDTRKRLIQLNYLRGAPADKTIAAIGSAKQAEVEVGVDAAAIKPNKQAVPWLVRTALSNLDKETRLSAVRTLALHDHPLAQWAIRVAADHDASKKIRAEMTRWAVYADLRN